MFDRGNFPSPARHTFIGIFLLALVTLMFEILLTRIFSVIMWYHFAFLAISVAMFGMSAGAMFVYLRLKNLKEEDIDKTLAQSSLLLSLSIIVAVASALVLPQLMHWLSPAWAPFLSVGAIYIVVTPPFLFSGIAVSLILSRYAHYAPRLYAADLLGAGAGCLLLLIALTWINTITVAFLIAALACLAALCFCFAANLTALKTKALAITAVIVVAGIAHALLSPAQFPFMRISTVKFQPERNVVFEKWNSFSRITVVGYPDKPEVPFAWGPSTNFPTTTAAPRLLLLIDGNNGTYMTQFQGKMPELDYLREDLVNIGHMLKPGSDVMVVGVGGGRDILSALAFKQKSVVGVEINDAILKALTKNFGDFSGHLDKYAQVKLINDEARSYLAQSGKHFDLIQISMIDTAAATAAGGFVLTENSLYTTEGWLTFLRHLNPTGVFTVSRWYTPGLPAEAYRLVSLAVDALKQMGVTNPRQHILMASAGTRRADGSAKVFDGIYAGVATIVVSPTAFSATDVNTFEQICKDKGYNIVLTPSFAEDRIFEAIASQKADKFLHDFPLQLNAPTDDNPYFFQMLKLNRLFDPLVWSTSRSSNRVFEIYGNMMAVLMLVVVLVMVIILTVACVLVPALMHSSLGTIGKNWALSTIFACLGLGFMFIEISQMQRLILLLGHPIYGLSVILFSLLISAGVGSFFTASVADSALGRKGTLLLACIPLVLLVCGVLTPQIVYQFQSHVLSERLAVSVALLLPMGFTMGMAFPLSMRVANNLAPDLTAWFWGINGATSVCASVMAVAISFSFGVSASYWCGCFVYAVTPLLFALAAQGMTRQQAGQ